MDYLSMPSQDETKYTLVAVDLYSRYVFAWAVPGNPKCTLYHQGPGTP